MTDSISDDELTRLYGELSDLFDQAIGMGKTREFDAEPDTDPERVYMASPQSRRFANAAMDAIGLGDALRAFGARWVASAEKDGLLAVMDD